jgi:hypothetical protein
MPLYNFALHDGENAIDDEGVWLADRERALEYAHDVARELMQAREPQTRAWRIDVYEGGRQIDRLPFARLDPTLDHLPPRLRMAVESSCESISAVRQVLAAARATLRESRALVRRSRGKPYLATERGEPTIRPAGVPRRKGRGGGLKGGQDKGGQDEKEFE